MSSNLLALKGAETTRFLLRNFLRLFPLKVQLVVDQINDLVHKNDYISEKDIIDIYDQFSI